jgi:MFS family permease
VLRVPDVRRIELGWGLSVIGELAGTVSLVVYAIGEGGATLVAAYGVARAAAGASVGLFVAGVGDRLRRDRLLRWITGLRAALLASAALIAAQGGPPVGVIAFAAASSAFSGTYRPLQAAILPWLVRTPADLTASNAAAAMAENAGALIGPVLAGALVAVADAPTAMAVAAGFLGLSTVAVRRLAVPPRPTGTKGDHRQVLRDLAEGIASFTRLVPPAGIAILLGAQTVVRGALTVLIAILAVDELGLGDAAVGWLTAALGVGGLLGGLVAASMIHATRLGRGFVVGLLLWGLPLAVLAIAPTPAVAYSALVVVGIGNAVEDVSVFTLLARLAHPLVVGRVLAAAELVALVGVGIGSVVVPPLLDTLGMSGTLGLLGGGLAALALGHNARFGRLDRTMPAPGPGLELMRSLPMFAPLSLAVTELVATELRPHHFPAGSVVIREGETGDEFHLVCDGSAAVSVRGISRPPLARGDYFGEIALLRDVPRTATITATEPLNTLSLGRSEFLAAVNGNSVSGAAAEAVVIRRLTDDPPGGTPDEHQPPESP